MRDLLSRTAVDPATGCWEWQGAKSCGYGHVRIDRRLYTAHRAVWEQLRGPIPEGLELDHLCRNKCCVNPDHLEPVTHRENMRRAASETCVRGHLFDEENTLILTRRGGTERRCRTCLRRKVECQVCGQSFSLGAISRHRRRMHGEGK